MNVKKMVLGFTFFTFVNILAVGILDSLGVEDIVWYAIAGIPCGLSTLWFTEKF